jgi:hypothetical protein
MSAAAVSARAAWAALLVLGLWGAVRVRALRPVAVGLGLMLAAQVALHGVYGYPTFLYSLHFLPMLVAAAAFAWFTPARWVACALAVVVIGIGVPNNLAQFERAAAMTRTAANELGAGWFALHEAKRTRPEDPWPRGTGHVLVGPFGANERAKGYVEPGGAFSPAFATFGLSFWVVDGDGTLLTTSADIPLARTRGRYLRDAAGGVGVAVSTPYYDASWRPVGGDGYALELTPRLDGDQRIEIAVRSVGPAGGALRRLAVGEGVLELDGGWTLGPVTPDMLTHLGVEGDAGWRRPLRSDGREVESPQGWAHARIAVPPERPLRLRLRRPQPLAGPAPPQHPASSITAADPAFAAALEAQLATLEAGLVGLEARPGDPATYHHPWLRDAAYVTVALARAGRVDLAERLALTLAPRDFLAPYGAEADAPGLGLWMLSATATLVDRADFDAAIWPHVRRKAELVDDMLNATADVRHPYTGPLADERMRGSERVERVARPAAAGLIRGRVGRERPLFYVNAVSYAGLRGAAALAERRGEGAAAVRWRAQAERLREAWRTAFDRSPAEDADRADPRTATVGLWPTAVAAPGTYADYLRARLPEWEQAWSRTPTGPERTDLAVAEVHQWLRSGWHERVRTALERFERASPFPGLGTLWEGDDKFDDPGIWPEARGWLEPPHATPDYRAAAEMLLLRLAMLAHVEEAGDGAERLVVGAGVPASWLSERIVATRVGTALGFVDWEWKDGRLHVRVPRPTVDIVPGPAFPPDTRITREIVERGSP